jgi:hypothetical protein
MIQVTWDVLASVAAESYLTISDNGTSQYTQPVTHGAGQQGETAHARCPGVLWQRNHIANGSCTYRYEGEEEEKSRSASSKHQPALVHKRIEDTYSMAKYRPVPISQLASTLDHLGYRTGNEENNDTMGKILEGAGFVQLVRLPAVLMTTVEHLQILLRLLSCQELLRLKKSVTHVVL